MTSDTAPTTTDATPHAQHRAQPAPVMIRGVLLRSVLLLELDAAGGGTIRVQRLCAAVHRYGFSVPGRVSKVVSDALRCEVVRGRVERTGRGRYRIGRLPRTTRRRCRRRVAAARSGTAPPWHLASGRRVGRPAAGRRSAAAPSAVAMSRILNVRAVSFAADDIVPLRNTSAAGREVRGRRRRVRATGADEPGVG